MFKLNLLCVVLLCLVTPVLYAQSSDDKGYIAQLDLAEKLSRTDKSESNRVLNELSAHRADFTQDESCYYQYLQIYLSGFEGDYEQSIKKIEGLLLQCDEGDHLIRSKKYLANLQVITGDYEQAIVNLNDAIERSQNSDNALLVAQVHNVASIAYRLMHQNELSIKYAEHLINAKMSDDYVCFGGINKYRILLKQGQPSALKNEVDHFLRVCDAAGMDLAALFLQLDWYRYSLVERQQNRGYVTSVLSDLNALQDEVVNTQFKNLHVYYQAIMAYANWLAQDTTAAKSYAEEAVSSNDSIGNSEQLILALDVLIQLNLQENDIKTAYGHLLTKTQAEKETYEEKMATQVAYFRVQHENLAQELQIEQLNQNNALLTLENRLAVETSKKQKLMMLLVLTLLFLLGLWTYKIKKRHDYFKGVSEIDHLTKVFTRKAFEDQMKIIIDECVAAKTPVNLAILDLDHFKNVNDQFGHLVGDWVLKEIIKACEEVIDEDVVMARLGGEEFCVVTPHISMGKTLQLIEKMRLAIQEIDCSPTGHDFNITASFGVSNSDLSGYRLSMLLTHADVALFEAKNGGRNQVVSFSSEQK